MEEVKRIPRSKPSSEPDLWKLAQTYMQSRRMREEMAAQEGRYKKLVMEQLSEFPDDDDRGHKTYTFPEPIGGVSGLIRQKRVSQAMDEVAAMALIKKLGLEDECLTTIVVVDEDALLAANYEGRIDDDDLKALYTTSESYALVTVKEK